MVVNLFSSAEASFYLPGIASRKASQLGLTLTDDSLSEFRQGGYADDTGVVVLNTLQPPRDRRPLQPQVDDLTPPQQPVLGNQPDPPTGATNSPQSMY